MQEVSAADAGVPDRGIPRKQVPRGLEDWLLGGCGSVEIIMFGSHLSKSSQRKVTKKAENGTSGGTNVFEFLSMTETIKDLSKSLDKDVQHMTAPMNDFLNGVNKHEHHTVLEAGVVKIAYDSNRTEPLPRDLIYSFWQACGSMLLDLRTIRHIVDASASTGRPLHLAAIDFQRSVMAFNFGIEPDYGCQQMGMAAINYPKDTELQEGASGFMRMAMHSFVEQLKVRAALRSTKGIALRTSGGMARNELLEFFEGCNASMTLVATHNAMEKAWKASKDLKDLGKICIDSQHQILELMGVTKEYGLTQLNSMQQNYAQDKELAMKFDAFRMCAETTVQLVSLSPKEKAEYLEEVPPYMRGVPHIYFIQKQRMQWEQQQQQNSQMASNPELMKHQENLLEFLNTDSGHDTVTGLVRKMNDTKKATESKVQAWSPEERAAYFQEFQSKDFIMEIAKCGGNMVERIQKFEAMSAADLDAIVMMQQTFNADARSGGELLAKLRSATPTDSMGGVSNIMQSVGALSRMAALPKGGKLEMPPAAKHMAGASQGGGGNTHDHSHDHGHSHEHGHACGHSSHSDKAPDVTSGKADTIER